MGWTAAAMGGLRALKEYLRSKMLMQDLPKHDMFSSWHGTPHVFPAEPEAPLGAFRNDKINTGEGAQAFTYGHYSTGHRPLAQEYRDTLTRRQGKTSQKDWVTRGQLAQIEPDIEHVPTLRFNRIDPSSPGYWFSGKRDELDILEGMQSPDRWLKDPRIARQAQAVVDPEVLGALNRIRQSNKLDLDWFSPQQLDKIRGNVRAAKANSSAEQFRRDIPNLDTEGTNIYGELLKALPEGRLLPSTQPAPGEITPELWSRALGREHGPVRSDWGDYMRPNSEFNNMEFSNVLRSSPDLRRELAKHHELVSGLNSGDIDPNIIGQFSGFEQRMGPLFQFYKNVLGRGGLQNLAFRMQEPEELAAMHKILGITDDQAPGALYRLEHNVSPDKLWFLDSPLIGQSDEFIRNFHGAGESLTSDFGKHASLGNTGHSNYNYLMKHPGMNSMPLTRQRNAEITDRMLEQDIPGAMYLRGGQRGDFDKVLDEKFNPDKFNFVTYDPALAEIVNKYKHGGLIQMKECGCK